MANNNNTKAEKKVLIKLPKTRELTSDVFVSVNEKTWQIQRGVAVEVPLCVAEQIKHKEKMEEFAMEYEASIGSAD